MRRQYFFEGIILLSLLIINLLFFIGFLDLLYDFNPTIIAGVIGFIGAVIGGLLTLIGVKWTIDNQKRREYIQALAMELPTHAGILLELKKLRILVEYLLSVENDYKSRATEEEMNNFYISPIEFDSILWERWDSKWNISDPVLLTEILKFEESFKRTIEVLEYKIESLETDENSKVRLNQIMEREKREYWAEMSFCNQKIEKIRIKLEERMESIQYKLESTHSDDYKISILHPDEFRIDRSK